MTPDTAVRLLTELRQNPANLPYYQELQRQGGNVEHINFEQLQAAAGSATDRPARKPLPGRSIAHDPDLYGGQQSADASTNAEVHAESADAQAEIVSGILQRYDAALAAGKYWSVLHLFSDQPATILCHPEIALAHSLAHCLRTAYCSAWAALEQADLHSASPGQRARVQSMQLLIGPNIGQAPTPAELHSLLALGSDTDQLDWDPEVLDARSSTLTFCLRWLSEPLPGIDIRQQLESTADALERAGWMFSAFSARLDAARSAPTLKTALIALSTLAMQALGVQQQGIALEAHVAATDLLLEDATLSIEDRKLHMELHLDSIKGDLSQHSEGLDGEPWPLLVRTAAARLAAAWEGGPLEPLQECMPALAAQDAFEPAFAVAVELVLLTTKRDNEAGALQHLCAMAELAAQSGSHVLVCLQKGLYAGHLLRTGYSGPALKLAEEELDADHRLFPDLRRLFAEIRDNAHTTAGIAAGDRHESSGATEGATQPALAMRVLHRLGPRHTAAGAAQLAAEDDATLAGWERRLAAEPGRNREVPADRQIDDIMAPITAAADAYAANPGHEGCQAFTRACFQAIKAADESLPRELCSGVQAYVCSLLAVHWEREEGSISVDSCLRNLQIREHVLMLGNNTLPREDAVGQLAVAMSLLRNARKYCPELDVAITCYAQIELTLKGAMQRAEGARARDIQAVIAMGFAYLNHDFADLVAVNHELRQGHLQLALAACADAEQLLDGVRRDYAVGQVAELAAAKRSLFWSHAELCRLSLHTTLQLAAIGQKCAYDDAWHMCQRGKSRTLADIMGLGSLVPVRLTEALAAREEAQRLVQQEQELRAALQQAPSADTWATTVEQLQSVLKEMETMRASEPALAEYMDFTTGAPIRASELPALAEMLGGRQASIAFVDWLVAGSQLWLSVRRCEGPPDFVELMPWDAACERVESVLGARNYKSALEEWPSQMLQETLGGLVDPLAALTEPGELLVLCPTGPLHRVPFHALEGGGQLLIMRNPCTYAPSLGILRQCALRRGGSHVSGNGLGSSLALFGNPEEGVPRRCRPETATTVRALHGSIVDSSPPAIGPQVTVKAVSKALRDSHIVHYQGHAHHNAEEPLLSCLHLADGKLTAEDILKQRGIGADLVVLAACQSAAQQIETGDEPQGLVAALLYAGASAVLGTLWKCNSPAAAVFMTAYYAQLMGPSPSDRASALQGATQVMLEGPENMRAPYYWAPFVLYGLWQ